MTMTTSPLDLSQPRAAFPVGMLAWRCLALLVLGVLQGAALSFLFVLPGNFDTSGTPINHLRGFVHAAVLAVATFALILWPERQGVIRELATAVRTHTLTRAILVNLAIFAAAAAGTAHISWLAANDAATFWLWIVPYLAVLATLGASLANIAAPLSFWRTLVTGNAVAAVFSGVMATLLLGGSEMAKGGWEGLSGATLNLSAWVLQLFGADLVVDEATKRLALDQFAVTVGPDCSGYEGIALVAAFLVIYAVVFRRELAFPNALLIFPIAIAAIWIFNSVRIAALVAIGAYISPDVAINGFHSQAGWIAFLLVAGGIMWAGYKVPFFRTSRAAGPAPATATPAAEDTALVWLAPFIGLMAASIVISAASPNEHWLYFLRVAGIGLALWLFRDFYMGLVARVSPVALLAGAAVGAAWIATDPDPAGNTELKTWLTQVHLSVLSGWFLVRGIGTIVLVPIAEELAFRGYLHRAIEKLGLASPAVMTAVAFVVTSVLFGVIHQRWLAGMLAGAVYALVMYRSRRMSDPIAAHMASNAVIFAWALYYQQWSLL
jgi:exosortase E/protease (VPEID-CTERM system)